MICFGGIYLHLHIHFSFCLRIRITLLVLCCFSLAYKANHCNFFLLLFVVVLLCIRTVLFSFSLLIYVVNAIAIIFLFSVTNLISLLWKENNKLLFCIHNTRCCQKIQKQAFCAMLWHDHSLLCRMIFNTVYWVRVIFKTLDLTFEPLLNSLPS